MVPLLQEWIDSEETLDTLQQKLQQYYQLRDGCEKYSVDFQFYWSVVTYLQDIITHAPK